MEAPEALAESERRFRALTTQAPVGIFETDSEGACLFVNDRWSELTGMAMTQALGTGWAEALHPEDRDRVFSEWTAATAAGREFELEYRFQRPDGSSVWVIGRAGALRDDTGAIRGYLGTCLDITERKHTEAARREAEQRFTAAFESAAVGMAIVGIGPGNNGRFLKVNGSLCQMIGYPEMDLLGRTFAEITHPDDVDRGLSELRRLIAGEAERVELDKRYLRADGTPLWVQVNAALVRDAEGRPLHTVAQILDINDRKELEERLRYLAGYDQMTGLFNRYRFEQELERELAYARRYAVEGVLVLADLDHFKHVNDSLGHHAGDELLEVVATTLRHALRESDLLGRLGGDEFVVFLPHTDLAGGETVAQMLVERIRSQTISLGGYEVQTTASAGVAIFDPRADTNSGTLLIRADRAMYLAKDAGGDGYVVYDDRVPQLAPPHWKSAGMA